MELPCKDCVSGYVLPGDVKGAFADGAYFSPAPSRHEGEKAAIVLLTDSFGLQLKNPKILADFFADRLGCDAFVPDLFHGQGGLLSTSTIADAPLGSPPINERDLAPYIKDEPGQPRGIIETLKWLAVMVPLLPGLFANRPSVGLARAEAVRKSPVPYEHGPHPSSSFSGESKRAKGIRASEWSGTPLLRGRGSVSKAQTRYCYGGGVALGIATRTGLVDAVVACHPGPVDIDDVRNSTTPLAMLCADGVLGPGMRGGTWKLTPFFFFFPRG